MQFRNPCRIFLCKKREKLRSVFQNDRTNTMFPKKPFSKISTEHLECSYDYHEGKIRQKVKKTSLRVQKRRKVFPLKIRRFCSIFNTVGKNATFCRKSFFTLNEVFPYKRRMQLKISTEKDWKKTSKKLLNVQKCWKIFFLQKTCFSFFLLQRTRRMQIWQHCWKFSDRKLERFCSRSQIDEKKSNTSQMTIFLQIGPMKT